MTYKIFTLGCKVNTYESQIMEEKLEAAGYKKAENPGICIINTCTVTNTADSKSFKIIRRVKREYPEAIIVVVGCLPQNKKEDVEKLGVDIILGNKNKSEIVSYLKKYNKKQTTDVYSLDNVPFECMQLNNFNLTRAYIKIEDGCNNYCSYCIIPYVRGNVRSKTHEEVLIEANSLIKNGHKEIVLTGIHTGHYHDKNYDFSDLLIDLLKIKGLERLRISSIEITELNDKFLNVLKNNKVLVNHMHIPLQSGSDEILKLMNRKYDKEYFISKINKIRKIRPNMSITTDVIIGFPGETEELFEETVETIKKIKFSKLHVFPYSNRKGTPADTMPDQVPNEIKKTRVKKLMELSKTLEIEYMNKFIGEELEFLPEIEKNQKAIGHTENYLLIKTNKCKLNNLQKVRLVNVNYPYIEGELIDEMVH